MEVEYINNPVTYLTIDFVRVTCLAHGHRKIAIGKQCISNGTLAFIIQPGQATDKHGHIRFDVETSGENVVFWQRLHQLGQS